MRLTQRYGAPYEDTQDSPRHSAVDVRHFNDRLRAHRIRTGNNPRRRTFGNLAPYLSPFDIYGR